MNGNFDKRAASEPPSSDQTDQRPDLPAPEVGDAVGVNATERPDPFRPRGQGDASAEPLAPQGGASTPVADPDIDPVDGARPVSRAGGLATGDAAGAEKASEIKTLESLLQYAYGLAGKKLTAPKGVYEHIDRNTLYPLESETGYPFVSAASASDPLLGVPPRLLIHAEEADAPARVRKRVVDCMSYALRLHQVFHGQQLQDLLISSPRDATEVDAAFDVLRVAVDRVPAGGADGLKETERAKLRVNAITSLALVLALRDGWAIDRLVECLYRHLWRIDSTTAGSFRPRSAIADSRTPDVLGAVALVFERRVTAVERQIAEIRRQNEMLVGRVLAGEQELEARDAAIAKRGREVATLRAQVAELEQVINRERHSRVVDQSHHVDDYETLRTRVVRLLDRQARLLTDGLHALRNDRVSIADEFVERALDAFERELQQLRDREEQGR